MRQHLREHFDEILVIDLGGEGRGARGRAPAVHRWCDRGGARRAPSESQVVNAS